MTATNSKLQRILKPLGFESIIVLVDRVDEPHLINGSAERMRDFLWSMFDNKFLKHPGIGFKMLLPRDVVYFLYSREEKEYEQIASGQTESHQVARMDR